MKKMSILFSILFFLGLFPTSVCASETKLTEETIYQIGAEVFPEYADKILSRSTTETAQTNSYLSGCSVTFSESRSVSENEEITYQEYENGTFSLVLTAETILKSSSSGSGYRLFTVDITAVHSYLVGAMYINDFTYTIIQGANDQINSFGGTATSTIETELEYARAYEGTVGPATAIYLADYPHPNMGSQGDKIARCRVIVQVGEDEYNVSTSMELMESV